MPGVRVVGDEAEAEAMSSALEPLFSGPDLNLTDEFVESVERDAGVPFTVTETCPDCGTVITGKNKGPGSIAWKRGLHRKNVHGEAGKGKAGRKKAGAPTAQDYEAHPVTSAIRDVAAEIGGKGTPNTEQLTNGLGRLVGLSSYTAASWAIESDRNFPAGLDKQMAVDYLSLAEADAKALMHPVARLLAPTKLNAKYGRTVIDNVDLVGAIAGLAQLGWHWSEYLKMRREGNALMRAQLAQSAPSPLMAVPDLENLAAPPTMIPNPDAIPAAYTPPVSDQPGAGYVMTQADVMRIKAGQA